MANSNTTSLPPHNPATSVSKPKDRKPKERKSFWSRNSRELDRIGWNTRYAFSDSDDSDEKLNSSSSSEQTNDEDSNKNDSGQETTTATNKGDSNRNSISITTIINQEPNLPTPTAGDVNAACLCHRILKRPLDSYDADLRQEILLEVYNWLNGGEHNCSSIPALAFASSSTASSDNDAVVLNEQQRDDYYQLVSQQEYWTEVNWAGDGQTPDNENAMIDAEATNHDEEWEDIGVDVLNIETSAQVEWIMVLVFVIIGQLAMMFFAEGVMRWLGV